MKAFVFVSLFFVTLSVQGIELPGGSEIIQCEPSLIFSETFALEDPYCFSYTIISEIAPHTDLILSYLNQHQDDTEQHYFRLSYYLRTGNFFSALITFIHMANIGVLDSAVIPYEKEFTNIIAGGIKNSKSASAGKMYGQRTPDSPMSITEFSTNFFAVVSYLASQNKTPPDSKEDTDLKILSMAFQYTFSNFFNGIDLEKDSYLKTLFSQIIKLKNAKLLNSYLEFFFFFLKKTGNAPQYRKYRLLKDEGAIAGFDRHLNNKIASSRMKKLFASFYLDNIEKMPQIEYSGRSEISKISKNGLKNVCSYLENREEWLKSLVFKDPDDIRYNESVRIVENCPGAFRLPFIIFDDRIVVEKEYWWITDIAIALKYITDNNTEQKSAESILNGAVRSSLSKVEGSDPSKFADLLYFFYYTDRSSDLLFALYSRRIGYLKKDVSDPVNWAVDFLSSALF